jgi:hypothetical protein
MRVLISGCLSAVVAAGIPAQAVHVVGPGGFAQIRDALTVAGPGDHLLVLPGTYAHFDAAVGVTIRALLPGTVNVSWDPAYMPAGCAANIFCMIQEGRSVLSTPPGQTLTLVDLTFPDTLVNVNGVQIPNRVEILGGRVVLEDCTIRAFDVPALSVSNASVHMIRGLVGGSGFSFTAHGLRASTSTITAVGTRYALHRQCAVAAARRVGDRPGQQPPRREPHHGDRRFPVVGRPGLTGDPGRWR